MVACIVQELGKVRPVCFSRSLLFSASDSLEAGDVIKAGCQLREACTRYLVSMCEYHGCTPQKKQHRTPVIMNRALLKAGGIDRGIYRWIREIIDYGNRCAHCRPVRSELIETSIQIMCFVLDNSPEVNLPERTGGVI